MTGGPFERGGAGMGAELAAEPRTGPTAGVGTPETAQGESGPGTWVAARSAVRALREET